MFSVKPQRGHSFTTLGLKTDAGGAGGLYRALCRFNLCSLWNSAESGSASPLPCLRRRALSFSIIFFYMSSRLLCVGRVECVPRAEPRAWLFVSAGPAMSTSCCRQTFLLLHSAPICPGTVLQHTSRWHHSHTPVRTHAAINHTAIKHHSQCPCTTS